MHEVNGLSSQEAQKLLATYGPNRLETKKPGFIKKFAAWAISPISLMLLATALVSWQVNKKEDFWIILFLFFSNFGITVWHEGKADRSVEKLQQSLTLRVRVLRDGTWQGIDSASLVPGDVVELVAGAIVPADATLTEAKNVSVNESMLTGESLPRQKQTGDTVYSGSFLATGYAVACITTTGGATYFGKTVIGLDQTKRQSALEKDILSINAFISLVSLGVIAVLTVVLLAVRAPANDIALLDLSLLIAGIPVALPTVMSLIISIGVFELAKKHVVVRRLASLEDLANVTLLLSDKTGTLTENDIRVERVAILDSHDEREVVRCAVSAIFEPDQNPLENAIRQKADELGLAPFSRIDFTPADSERKRSTVVVERDGTTQTITLGAAQVVRGLCRMNAEQNETLDAAVASAARGGFRVLAVALQPDGNQEKDMELLGILELADRLRDDAHQTIAFMRENGIGVKMLTGDGMEISRRIAGQLGISGAVYERSVLDQDAPAVEKAFAEAAGFAQVLPKDKYELVKLAQKRDTVAVTGDGVNDLPAVKAADVGFAVSNAVDALKSSADIVLLASGIAVIRDAIIEARKIFVRLYNYSTYRISESFRIVITIAVIGLLYHTYPLTPVQLIVLAFLNDLPIVSLAFDRVEPSQKPARVNAKERFTLSTLFGLAGTANSLILLWFATSVLHLPWDQIQTMFFLKLTVSGHMLIYVAHTEKRWYRFLPSPQVIWATTLTQGLATACALAGIFVTPLSVPLVLAVWLWSFFWMQVSEVMKSVQRALVRTAV